MARTKMSGGSSSRKRKTKNGELETSALKRPRAPWELESLEEKKRKLVPAKWTSTEVSEFVAARAQLTKSEAKCVEISGESLQAEPLTAVSDSRLQSVGMTKRKSVVAACNALVDPLMPKFLLYDSSGDGVLDSEEFMHLVCANAGKIMPSQAEVEAMMAEADLDCNGGLDFDEFRAFVNTHESWAAQSVRSSVFAELLRAEGSFLKAISPLFPREPSIAAREIRSGGSKKTKQQQQQPASSVERLKLTSRAKWSSNCCSVCLLFLLAALLFVPAIYLADWAVEDFAHLEEDNLQAEAFNQIQTQHKPCRQFLKENCPKFTDDQQWSKSDYRSCSKLLHPDKGGTKELMAQLTECHSLIIDGFPGFPRSTAYITFLLLTIAFAVVMVEAASVSSTTAALAVAINFYVHELPAVGKLTKFPDLVASSRVFVVFITAALLLLHGLLSLRGQSCLAQWLSGTKICDATTGRPVKPLRVYALDLSAALSDAVIFALVAVVQAISTGSSFSEQVTKCLSENAALFLFEFIVARFVLQWILNRSLENCSFAERITGTVLLWQQPAIV